VLLDLSPPSALTVGPCGGEREPCDALTKSGCSQPERIRSGGIDEKALRRTICAGVAVEPAFVHKWMWRAVDSERSVETASQMLAARPQGPTSIQEPSKASESLRTRGIVPYPRVIQESSKWLYREFSRSHQPLISWMAFKAASSQGLRSPLSSWMGLGPRVHKAAEGVDLLGRSGPRDHKAQPDREIN